MALESFYGGKQGVSPVIKARFKYINKDDQAYKDRIGLVTTVTEEEATWLTDAGIKQGETVTLDNNDQVAILNDNDQVAYEPTTEGSGVSYKKGDLIKWNAVGLKPFTMDECLKDINYRDVWYGELCIIDTDSKYNPNNGKIYRRTLKQVNNHNARVSDTLYAEYVGQIVGPTGGIPKFDISSVDVARQKATGQAKTYSNDAISDNPRQDWSYSYRKDSDQYVISSEIPTSYNSIGVFAANDNNSNIDMVPGKVVDEEEGTVTYNDSIRYTWCNVTRKNEEGVDQDSWIYLGFEIPYTSWDITYNPISYTASPFVNDIQKIDNVFHPFYHNLTFNIPRGARGIGPEEIFIVGKDNRLPPAKLYKFNAITYDSTQDIFSIANNAQEITPTEKTYWVGKWVLRNPGTPDTTDVYQYLGSYQDIADIKFNDTTGKIEIKYSKDSDYTPIDNPIDYVKSLRIDTDKTIVEDGQEVNNPNFGNLYKISNITNNNNNNTKITTLPLIKEVKINDNNGHLYVTYAGVNEPQDAGQAKYSPTIGIVTQIHPLDSFMYGSTTNYETYGNVIQDLNNGWASNVNGVTIYGTNAGTNSGKIIVNTKDYTNGLIGAPIAKDWANNPDGDADLGLFYYDGALDGNNNPKGWVFIGLYGELSNDNGIFILDQADKDNSNSIYEPLGTSRKPEFYFDYSLKYATILNTDLLSPIWVNS